MTHWLDEDERAAWLRFVMLLELMPGVLSAQLRKDADLSHFEYFVLAMLSEAPEHTLRMTGLATMTNATLPRLSHVVSRLEQRGYVVREADASDGRATNARLSEEGLAKVIGSAPGHVDHVRSHVIDALTPEQIGQLGEICEAMLERIPAAQEMLHAREETMGSPDPC